MCHKEVAASIIFLLILSLDADASDDFLTPTEMIKRASLIAIVHIEEPEGTQPPGIANPFDEQPRYGQKAKVKVEMILKGDVLWEFTLWGAERNVSCIGYYLPKGKFLVFLIQKGDQWAEVSPTFSLCRIREKEVNWFESKEELFPMKFQNLDHVIDQILSTLNYRIR